MPARIGVAAMLLIIYWAIYFVLRGTVAVRVWNRSVSLELGGVYFFMCLFVAAGFFLFKPASRAGRLSLYLCTALTAAATIMVLAVAVLPKGGHPSMASILFILFSTANLVAVPVGLALLAWAFLAGDKFLFFGSGLIYFFGLSLYAFAMLGIDIPHAVDGLLGVQVFSRIARHLDCRCPDYEELGQDITLLRKCRYLSDHRQYVLRVLAARHPEHRGEVVREIHSQFAKINGDETKVRALGLLEEVHRELVPTAEVQVDSVKFFQSKLHAPESRVREWAFFALAKKVDIIGSRQEYDAVTRDLVRIYQEGQRISDLSFIDQAADDMAHWPVADPGRRHAITNLLLFIPPAAKWPTNNEYIRTVTARIESLRSINIAFEQGGYEEVDKDFVARAERGDTAAMVSIGLLYQRGEGFKQDHEKAMDWYLKAFTRGDADSYNYIAACYRDGLGVRRNLEIACALHWMANRRGIGSFAAQRRLQRGFSAVTELLSSEKVQECRNMDEGNVRAYVERRGKPNTNNSPGQAGK
jgi:hypothetical protein